MNSRPVEPGDKNLSKSGLGKPDERIRSEDWQKDSSGSTLPIRPQGTERNVALASRPATFETDEECLRADDETAEEET